MLPCNANNKLTFRLNDLSFKEFFGAIRFLEGDVMRGREGVNVKGFGRGECKGGEGVQIRRMGIRK